MAGDTTARLTCILVALLIATACTGSDPGAPAPGPPVVAVDTEDALATAPPVAQRDGQVSVALAPPSEGLDPWAVADATDAAAVVGRTVLAPLWRTRPDGTSEPWLLGTEPRVQAATADTPFRVTYTLRADATWSDGQPIDGQDVLFTLGVCAAAPAAIRQRECAAVDVDGSTADGRRVTVAFERPQAAWREVLSTRPVLPEHVLTGRNAAAVWREGMPVASGPFRVARADADTVVLERNPRWWGVTPPLRRVVLRFAAERSARAMIDAGVDVARVTPSVRDAELAAAADLRVQAGLGTRRTVVDFDTDGGVTADADVRRALAAALDRTVMIDELVAPVAATTAAAPGDLLGGQRPVGSVAIPDHDPVGMSDDLTAAGCTGVDDVLTCDGTPVELSVTVAEDVWQRDVVAEYLRTQLATTGATVRVTVGSPADVAAGNRSTEPSSNASPSPAASTSPAASLSPADEGTDVPVPAVWHLAVHTVAMPTDPALLASRWRCDDAANVSRWCDPRYDDVVERAGRTLDGAARDELYAEAEDLLAGGLASVALYDQPVMLVHRPTVQGPQINDHAWGDLWNLDTWARVTR